MYPSQQSSDDAFSFRNQFNLAAWFLHIWAISLEVMLHHNLGRRYPGPAGAFVLLLVPVYCLGWQGHDLRGMLLFLGLYVLYCFIHRLDALTRKPQATGHSRYTGTPLIQPLFPGVSEVTLKCWHEPILVMAMGGVWCCLYAPLGWYLILGGICLRLSTCLSQMDEQAQATDLNDAAIEQELIADRFRRMREEDY